MWNIVKHGIIVRRLFVVYFSVEYCQAWYDCSPVVYSVF